MASIPVQKQIEAERAANLARAKQVMGMAKAAAAISQGIAPRVQSTYSNAANADAGYARGLGNDVQSAVNQQAQGDNAFLTKMGTPSGGLVKPADVGGTAYGLEGYIPATTLQREGAAFGSAAQMLPADLLSQGNQSATAALNDNANIAKLQAQLSDIASKQPALYQSILTGLQNQAAKNIELNQAQQRIGISRQSLASENAYRQAEIGLRAQSMSDEQAYRAAELSLRHQSMKQAWARIGISEKNIQLRAMQSEAKAKGGGFSPDELVHIRGEAGKVAYFSKNGSPAHGSTAASPPVGFKQAMRFEILHGIPPSIAIKALADAGYKVPPQATKLQKTLTALAFGGGIQNSKQAQTLVALAHQYMGTPYVWGGKTPAGFDCSGFAQYIYGKVGISIPGDTYAQWAAPNGRPVKQSQLQPGDLVFFRGSDSRGGLPGHVGIYIGNGQMIDAPHTGADVRIESVNGFGGYMGARRYH